MLTADHVKLRRRKGVVDVVPLCGLDDERALELASFAVDIAKTHEGESRATLEEALDELPVEHDEVRFGRGLKKLALDACAFDVDTELDPETVRHDVFLAAAHARNAGEFERARVIAEVAASAGTQPDVVERALYADLSAAHAVTSCEIADGAEMLARYRVAELQAVLLRATRVTLDVDAKAPALRALLRTLKLHQLLFDVGATPDGEGVRLVVEGPMGLFQQSTRYGLKLALLLPALLATKLKLEAMVRLRKGGGVERFALKTAGDEKGGAALGDAGLGEIASALLDELRTEHGEKRSPWSASAAVDVLKLAGAGALVPDLKLVHDETGEVVFVEVLGFWSRAAVWKRVELVEKGLPYRVVFCASERLRVSEQALPDDAGSALVVFKGVLRASRVLEAVQKATATKTKR